MIDNLDDEDLEGEVLPDGYQLPPGSVAFVFMDDNGLELVRSRSSSPENDARMDALYKLITETNNDPQRLLKVISRGLAIEEWKLH